MNGLIPTAKKIFDKHGSTILTALGAVGVVATSVLTAMATPKAIDKIRLDSKEKHGDENAYTTLEAVSSAAVSYIPAILVGGATITCIFGANALNKTKQAALSSACAFIGTSYNEYKSKLKELYGEEAHNKIVDAIVKEHCEDVHITSESLCSVNTLDFNTAQPEVVRTFYDSFSQRYFESTTSKVLQAEYHLNRNYYLGCAASVNEFYSFLGLEPIDGGDILGWSMYSYEGMWIDFNHHTTQLDDGMEICVIDYAFTPESLGEDEY